MTHHFRSGRKTRGCWRAKPDRMIQINVKRTWQAYIVRFQQAFSETKGRKCMSNQETTSRKGAISIAEPSYALNQEEKRLGKSLKKNVNVTAEELSEVSTRTGLRKLLESKNIDIKKTLIKLRYEEELEKLQIELVRLQRSVQMEGRRVAIILEGRDAAGKGGTIRRFIEHLNPRSARVVALPKPTEVQQGQWYFQRYVEKLPNPGEIVFFDRSWYNRAVVEPVMGF